MLTAALFFIIYIVAWIATRFSEKSGSSILSIGLHIIIPVFLVILIVYSIIIACTMHNKLINFRYTPESKKVLCFFIFAFLGFSLLFGLILPTATKLLEVIFILMAIACIVTYLVMFAFDCTYNEVSFPIAIPKFLTLEVKAVVVFIIATLALGLTIAQLLFYLFCFIGILFGVFDFPSLDNLMIVRYFKWLDSKES